jgi:alkylation response protein AidB-like acyl-CoA dehydrogenase
VSDATDVEPVSAFRVRARKWLLGHMPPHPGTAWIADDTARWRRARELQRRLWDGGFAGLCFPREYGGQGLTPSHQKAFDQEAAACEMPVLIDIPTIGIIAPTLLDFGSEEQKQRHLPGILRGDEVWVQLLSEPTGGSDLASVITRATPDGGGFLLNGSKIWSSGAYAADYGLCVARTNWDVPKHDGITVLIVAIDQPGVTVERIRGVAGDDEFCQEFFDDVRIPAENVVGRVGAGWTVVQGLLGHERNAMGGSSPYVGGPNRGATPGARTDLASLARSLGRSRDPLVRQCVGEGRTLALVQEHTSRRVMGAMARGELPPAAGAILRLMGARHGVRRADLALEIAGAGAGVWRAGDAAGAIGVRYLARQGSELGGGSTEIQRNIVSERVLGMPREPAADRGVPFKDVRRNAMPTRGRTPGRRDEGG